MKSRAETGLFYYGARYYNPRESLWLSVDPLAEQTMTPYQYTYQNPIRYTDPTGMAPENGPGDPPKKDLQTADDGYGDLYQRSYSVSISDSKKTAKEIFKDVNQNFSNYTEGQSYFEKISGGTGQYLEKGDELAIVGAPGYGVYSPDDYFVPGHYNAIVKNDPAVVDAKGNVHFGLTHTGVTVINSRVDDKNNTYSMTFQTWKGHVEAGTITFTASGTGSNVNFTISSTSRSANRLIDAGYNNGRITYGYDKQTEHWTTFLNNVSKYSGSSSVRKPKLNTIVTPYKK